MAVCYALPTVVALHPRLVYHGVKSEFTDLVALGAVVAEGSIPFYPKNPFRTHEGPECSPWAEVPAPCPRRQRYLDKNHKEKGHCPDPHRTKIYEMDNLTIKDSRRIYKRKNLYPHNKGQ